jgi:hypothetical protein
MPVNTKLSTPDEEPQPPQDVPSYTVDPLERQDADTLRKIAAYANELAAWRERELDVEEIEADAVRDQEELEDVVDTPKGTVVRKMIPCGDDCNGCPHGPYEYLAYRVGDSVVTEYIGKAE